jgi:hypothetical protein
VKVDVGIVSLELGALAARRGAAHELANMLIDEADQLMYAAKQASAPTVYVRAMRVARGGLQALGDAQPCGQRVLNS